jgi:hypothetical protein
MTAEGIYSIYTDYIHITHLERIFAAFKTTQKVREPRGGKHWQLQSKFCTYVRKDIGRRDKRAHRIDHGLGVTSCAFHDRQVITSTKAVLEKERRATALKLMVQVNKCRE